VFTDPIGDHSLLGLWISKRATLMQIEQKSKKEQSTYEMRTYQLFGKLHVFRQKPVTRMNLQRKILSVIHSPTKLTCSHVVNMSMKRIRMNWLLTNKKKQKFCLQKLKYFRKILEKSSKFFATGLIACKNTQVFGLNLVRKKTVYRFILHIVTALAVTTA